MMAEESRTIPWKEIAKIIALREMGSNLFLDECVTSIFKIYLI